MKQAILSILVFFFIALAVAQKKTFLRIYNQEGKKIAKGFFAGTADSMLMLASGKNFKHIMFSEIGTIKTKRTVGHTIAAVAGTAAVLVAIISVANSGGDSWFSYSAGEGLAAGLVVGAAAGLIPGTFAGLLKNSLSYKVNGKYDDWIKAKTELDKMPVYRYSMDALSQ